MAGCNLGGMPEIYTAKEALCLSARASAVLSGNFDVSMVYDARDRLSLSSRTACQLLLGHLNETLRDEAPERTCIASRIVAIVSVLRNRNSQLLSDLVLHLLQGCSRLRHYEIVGAASTLIRHAVHLPVIVSMENESRNMQSGRGTEDVNNARPRYGLALRYGWIISRSRVKVTGACGFRSISPVVSLPNGRFGASVSQVYGSTQIISSAVPRVYSTQCLK